MKGNVARLLYKKINDKLMNLIYGEKGITDVQLVEYFLLLVMISIFVAAMVIKIPEVHAKLWAKINTDLFK